MGELWDISQTRVKHTNLIVKVRSDVIWELVHRILNTKIFGTAEMYRNQTFNRANDVSFKTSIAVKSKKKYN